jgi:hypothetical protein
MTNDPSPLTAMQEIQILSTEYNALKAELLQRNASAYQAIGTAGTLLIGISAYVFTKSICGGIALLISLFIVVWFVLRVLDYDTRNAAARIRELEHIINLKAGSKLLAWETDHGLLSHGAVKSRSTHLVAPLKRVLSWLAPPPLVAPLKRVLSWLAPPPPP